MKSKKRYIGLRILNWVYGIFIPFVIPPERPLSDNPDEYEFEGIISNISEKEMSEFVDAFFDWTTDRGVAGTVSFTLYVDDDDVVCEGNP